MTSSEFQQSQKLMETMRNIGPAVSEQLVSVGIDTPEKLRELGAKEAFLQIFAKYAYTNSVNACYLYALEGAIEDIPWNAISEEKKQHFKEFTNSIRESFGSSSYTA